MCQNISNSFSYGIIDASNSICVASACPVLPEETSSYVGFSVVPPVYPGTTLITPFNLLNIASVHQKHPPAIVANSCVLSIDLLYSFYGHASRYGVIFIHLFMDGAVFFLCECISSMIHYLSLVLSIWEDLCKSKRGYLCSLFFLLFFF